MRSRYAAIVAMTLALALSGVTGCSPEGPSADCTQAEMALRPWGAAMFDVHRTLPPDIAPSRDPGEAEPDYAVAAASEAQAARDIRAGADSIQSSTLRADVQEVAAAFEMLSRSRLQPTTPGAPSKEFFLATTRINEALHDVVMQCPGIGDELPPPPVRRS